MKTVIIFGSTTGNTEDVAKEIAAAFPGADVLAAGSAGEADVAGCGLLILGASTWGLGDLQDDMAAFLGNFANWNVSIPFGAVFGLGNQEMYADTFVDGMADMAAALKAKGIQLVGSWPAAGYTHSHSRAQQGDAFIGLALDNDNESDKTAGRIAEWAKQVLAATGA